jgi:hypothetical protein
MARNAYWDNKDGLVVGFGTRTATITGGYGISENGATSTAYYTIRGEDLGLTVAATDDMLVHGPVIPNGSVILSATLTVTEAFDSASNSATLNIGLYDVDGGNVDPDGIDATIAESALTLAAVIACDGDDVGTVVATTGGVRVNADADTEVFTAGEAILEVVFTTPS